MYSPEQIEKAKAFILKYIATGSSLLSIIDFGRTKPQGIDETSRFTQQQLDEWVKIPSRPIVYEWFNPNHPNYDVDFLNNYTQAREDSADIDVDKMEKIVDDVLSGAIDPAQARAAADILKWTAGRKKPKKYGDKLDLTTGGKQITQQVTVFKMPENGRASNDVEETPE